jgi:hypothetical protein
MTEDDGFGGELRKLISELASRPVKIDGRRVRWCLNHGISPFVWVADGECERWQLVTDQQVSEIGDGLPS